MKKLLMTLLPTTCSVLAASPFPLPDLRLNTLFAPLLVQNQWRLFRNENRSRPAGSDNNTIYAKPLPPELRNGGIACTLVNVQLERANRGDV